MAQRLRARPNSISETLDGSDDLSQNTDRLIAIDAAGDAVDAWKARRRTAIIVCAVFTLLPLSLAIMNWTFVDRYDDFDFRLSQRFIVYAVWGGAAALYTLTSVLWLRRGDAWRVLPCTYLIMLTVWMLFGLLRFAVWRSRYDVVDDVRPTVHRDAYDAVNSILMTDMVALLLLIIVGATQWWIAEVNITHLYNFANRGTSRRLF